MADHSKIEWTDATWNIVTGCGIVSPGCTNCYAMRLAGTRLKNHPSRAGLTKPSRSGPVWTGEVRFNEQWLDQPRRWRKPRRIFVAAHGDLFHPGVPDGWIMSVLNVIWNSPHHTFQVLTKRPERMRAFFKKWCDLAGEDHGEFIGARGPDEVRNAHLSGRGQLFADWLDHLLELSGGLVPDGAAWPTFDWAGGMMRWPDVPPNLWLGTSVEDQQRADERIPHLLSTPAAKRFVSAEPLLGPVNLTLLTYDDVVRIDALTGECGWPVPHEIGGPSLDWVIVGGESQAGARPMHPDWARSLRDQCAAAGVAFHFKQWGDWFPFLDRDREDPDWRADYASFGRHPERYRTLNLEGGQGFHGDRVHIMERVGKKAAGRLLDGRTHDEVPA